MSDTLWTETTPEPGDEVALDGLYMRWRAPSGASLISGDLEAAIAALAPGAPFLGLLADLPSKPFALRIARDRALLCTAAPLGLSGWQSGYAISAADDLYLVVSITGTRASLLQAALFATDVSSPSAAIRCGGLDLLAASEPNGLRLWVPRPHAAALWAWFRRLADAL